MVDAADSITTNAGAARIGYARVSTAEQSLDAQIEALKSAGCTVIYSEHASGTKDDRPELAQAIKALRAGDTLVVWRLDRLGRSLSHLIGTVNGLAKTGVGFESITEKIDTSSAVGELVFNMFATLAQFERQLNSERTKAALDVLRARGRKGGRKAALTIKQIRQAKTLMDDPELTASDVAKTFGVSRATLYNGLKRLKVDNSADLKAAA